MYRIIRIPPEKGEEIREKAINGKFLDTTRKIRKFQTAKGAFLEIPVTEAAGEKVGDFQVIEQEKPEFLTENKSLKDSLREYLSKKSLKISKYLTFTIK